MELSVRLNKASMLSGGGQKLVVHLQRQWFPAGREGHCAHCAGTGGGPTNILLRLIITFRAIDRRKDKGKDLNKDLEKRFSQRLKQKQWQDKDGDREICKDRDIVTKQNISYKN